MGFARVALISSASKGVTDNLTQLEQLYLAPYMKGANIVAFRKARSLIELRNMLLEGFEQFILVGHVPEWLLEHNEPRAKISHFIVDKYLVQSSTYELKATNSHIVNLIKRLYGNFRPHSVVVNNQLMRSDFQYAFRKLGIAASVYVAPHPISERNLNIFEQAAKQRQAEPSPAQTTGGKLLSDSGFPVDQQAFKVAGLEIMGQHILSLPYDKSFSEIVSSLASGKVIALFNYRPFSPQLKRADTWQAFKLRTQNEDLKQRFKWGVKFKLAALFSSLAKDFRENPLQGQDAAAYMNFNSRWKPCTKLSTALALGIPLVTERECSILEFADVLGFPVFELTHYAEFPNLWAKWRPAIEQTTQELLSQRQKWMRRLNTECEQAVLDALR